MARGGARPNSGGKRPGAGRKKGAATKRTRKTSKIAEQAAGAGVLPLQVLLEAMRAHHAAGALDAAAKVAAAAAPYMHPRLTSVRVGGDPANPVPITFVEVAAANAAAAGRDCDAG